MPGANNQRIINLSGANIREAILFEIASLMFSDFKVMGSVVPTKQAYKWEQFPDNSNLMLFPS